MTTTTQHAATCRRYLDRLRPTFRLLLDVVERLEDDHELDPEADHAVGLAVLRMLTTELRRDIEQLDMDLNEGTRPALGDYGHESEGGEI